MGIGYPPLLFLLSLIIMDGKMLYQHNVIKIVVEKITLMTAYQIDSLIN
jgi:hypothetical protein